jgi:hypothetical protein
VKDDPCVVGCATQCRTEADADESPMCRINPSVRISASVPICSLERHVGSGRGVQVVEVDVVEAEAAHAHVGGLLEVEAVAE